MYVDIYIHLSRSPDHRLPWIVSIWITRSPLIFLVLSVACFFIGLVIFCYSSDQVSTHGSKANITMNSNAFLGRSHKCYDDSLGVSFVPRPGYHVVLVCLRDVGLPAIRWPHVARRRALQFQGRRQNFACLCLGLRSTLRSVAGEQEASVSE